MNSIQTLGQVAVFSISDLESHDQEYLQAAAADPDTPNAVKFEDRILIIIAQDSEKNLFLHGCAGLQVMLFQARAAGCSCIEINTRSRARSAVTHKLPYGVKVSCDEQGVSLTSALAFELERVSEADGEAQAQGMESLITALAEVGFDVGSGAFAEALRIAVETANDTV